MNPKDSIQYFTHERVQYWPCKKISYAICKQTPKQFLSKRTKGEKGCGNSQNVLVACMLSKLFILTAFVLASCRPAFYSSNIPRTRKVIYVNNLRW